MKENNIYTQTLDTNSFNSKIDVECNSASEFHCEVHDIRQHVIPSHHNPPTCAEQELIGEILMPFPEESINHSVLVLNGCISFTGDTVLSKNIDNTGKYVTTRIKYFNVQLSISEIHHLE